MAGIDTIHTHEGRFILIICIIYSVLASFTAYVIAQHIPTWRGKFLSKLPARVQDHTILRRTAMALVILVSALLWPVVMAIAIPTIAITWLASEIQELRGSWLARRQREQIADLERAIFNSLYGEHRQNVREHGGQRGDLPIPMVTMGHVTEPPPAYTPSAPAHTIHRGQ